jgi:hypothetical protein
LGCRVLATVTVPSSVTLTGLSDLSLGTVPAGSTVQANESYTVATNNPAGYSLFLQADGGSAGQCNGGKPCFLELNAPGTPHQFPTQGNVTVQETATAPQTVSQWNNAGNTGPQVTTLNHTTSPTAGDHYNETYSVTIPGTEYPAAYDSDYFYLATAN